MTVHVTKPLKCHRFHGRILEMRKKARHLGFCRRVIPGNHAVSRTCNGGSPTNTKRQYNVGLKLGHRRRRWLNFKPTLCLRRVFTGRQQDIGTANSDVTSPTRLINSDLRALMSTRLFCKAEKVVSAYL